MRFDEMELQEPILRAVKEMGFEEMTPEQIKEFDLNDSIIHVDFMIGSADLSIVAKTHDGQDVQIFKDGTWAI